jgi:hypothetical protein
LALLPLPQRCARRVLGVTLCEQEEQRERLILRPGLQVWCKTMTIYAQYAINRDGRKDVDGNGQVVVRQRVLTRRIQLPRKTRFQFLSNRLLLRTHDRVRSQNRRSNAQGQAAPGGLKIFSGNGNMSLADPPFGSQR